MPTESIDSINLTPKYPKPFEVYFSMKDKHGFIIIPNEVSFIFQNLTLYFKFSFK